MPSTPNPIPDDRNNVAYIGAFSNPARFEPRQTVDYTSIRDRSVSLRQGRNGQDQAVPTPPPEPTVARSTENADRFYRYIQDDYARAFASSPRGGYVIGTGVKTKTNKMPTPYSSTEDYKKVGKLNYKKNKTPMDKQSLREQKFNYIQNMTVDSVLKMHRFITSPINIVNDNFEVYYDKIFDDGLTLLFKKNIRNGDSTISSLWDDRISLDQFRDNIYLSYLQGTKIAMFNYYKTESGDVGIECSSNGMQGYGVYFNADTLIFIPSTDGFEKITEDNRTVYYKESDMPKYVRSFRRHSFTENGRETTMVLESVITKTENGILSDIFTLVKKLKKTIDSELEELRTRFIVTQRRPHLSSKKHQSANKGLYLSHTVPFSCEIECYGPSKTTVAIMSNKISADIGISNDGSLTSDLGYPIEIQTPILKGKRGEICVAELSSTLVDMGFKVDKTCGLHIHLDGTTLGLREENVLNNKSRPLALINLYLAYRIYEPVILSFLPSTRRNNRYCADFTQSSEYHGESIAFHPVHDSFKMMSKVETLAQFEMYWYKAKEYDHVIRAKLSRYTPSRYYGVNFHSLLKDNHLEIRYHSGTLNYEKIMYWTDLHGKILEKCADGTINTKKLKDVLDSACSLEELTNSLFNELNLNKDTVEYLYDRQSKFKDAKASEEILIDKTKKLGVI